jgi:hypothetical protein
MGITASKNLLHLPVCSPESSFLWKMNSWKTDYFLIFGSIMKNNLELTMP